MKNLKSKIRAVNVLGALMMLMSVVFFSCQPDEGPVTNPIIGTWSLQADRLLFPPDGEIPRSGNPGCRYNNSEFIFNADKTLIDKRNPWGGYCEPYDFIRGTWQKLQEENMYRINMTYRYNGAEYPITQNWKLEVDQTGNKLKITTEVLNQYELYEYYIRK
ncbi:MAG: hypothetical protein C4K58_00315 [Flavobacteriaceae bacterium]|nr:MAG: hypothetical protein C4K58_00315 [Flavobacteriaceae bacterium]